MKNNDKLNLSLESLENRTMLSSVDIFAAGVTNEETIELQVDGATVQSWTNLGGDAYGGQFTRLNYNTSENLDGKELRIAFTNDFYDAANGIDRNVRIDRIVVDGETIQTESADVFSTGTWKADDGVVDGFRTSEYLHSDGYFQFPVINTGVGTNTNAGSQIEITVKGDEGTESFSLIIGGETVGTYNVTPQFQTVAYTHSQTVTADDIRIEFFNDRWEPANGIDANLTVDKITVDGVTFETEDPEVFSTGSWKAEDGIVSGFRQSETLNSNGYFQFSNNGASLTALTPTPATNGVIVGTSQDDDILVGTPGNDVFETRGGFDFVYGEGGFDTVRLPGVRSDYDVFLDEPTGRYNFTNLATVEGALLTDVERVEFVASGESVIISNGALPPTTPAPAPVVPTTPVGQPNSGVSITDPQTGQEFDLSGIFASLSPEAQAAFATGIANLNGSVTPTPVPTPVAPTTPVGQPNSGVNITDPQTGQEIDLSGIFASLSPEAQAAFATGIANLNGSVTPTPVPTPVAPTTPVGQPNSGVNITDPQTGQEIDLSGIFASLSPEAQAAFTAGIANLNGSATPTPTPTPTLPNAAPNANDDPGNVTNANTPITLDVLANDSDSDGNSLTITDASVPTSQGTVAIVNNRLVYSPAQGFGGVTTEIRYTVSDSNGGSDSATAFVYVFPSDTLAPASTPTPAPAPAPGGVIAGTPQNDDVLEGTPGNDVFETRGGFDFVFGEGGFDTVRLPGVRADYDVFLDEPTGRYNFTNLETVEGALLTDIERVEFIGSGESVIISNGALPPTTPTPAPAPAVPSTPVSVPNTGLTITDPQTGEVFDLSGIFASLAPGAQGAFAAGVAGINGGTTPAPAPAVPSTPVSVPNNGLTITDPQTGEVFDLSGIFASLAPGAQGAFAAGVAGINGGATPTPAPAPVAPVVPSTPAGSPNTGFTITDPETGEVLDLSGIFASLAPGAQGAFAAGVAGINGGTTSAPAPTTPAPAPAASNTTSRGIFTGTPAAGFEAYPFPVRYDSPDQIVPPGNYDLSDSGIQSFIDSGAAPYSSVAFNRAYLQGDIGGAYLTYQVGRDVQNGVPFDVAAARAVAAYPI